MKRSPRAGFSALEMALCFLAIGLMSCAIATLGHQVRDRSRAVTCMSNLQQLALATRMYAQDYGGRGPANSAPETMYPYVNNYSIFACPANLEGSDAWVQPDRTRLPLGYTFRTGLWTDDPPRTIIVQDIAPDLHPGGTWQAARLDGAVRTFPADEWQPLD